MRIVNGQLIAQKIFQKLKKEIKKYPQPPGLGIILVGNNPASELYVKLKENKAKEIGFFFKKYKFSTQTPEKIILEKINALNQDPKIHGILVQLPLPPKFNTQKIIQSISPLKDVDGFHPVNLKKIFQMPKNNSLILSPLIKAIFSILSYQKIKLKNQKFLILANSRIFSKTLSFLLKQKGCQGKIILKPKNLQKYSHEIQKANLIVIALGKPKIFKDLKLKKHAAIIDVGINRLTKKIDSKKKTITCGDVDVDSFRNLKILLTPVPGGVGPVTIASLFENLLILYKKQIEQKKI